IFAPGRTWSEASDEARRRPATACWIGAMPTPPERSTVRRWVAASRLAAGGRGKRYADLTAVLADLAAKAGGVFRRVYIDCGPLVTEAQSAGLAALVHPSRDENFVARLLPTPEGAAARRRAVSGLNGDAVWVARLLADGRESVDEILTRLDAEGWL